MSADETVVEPDSETDAERAARRRFVEYLLIVVLGLTVCIVAYEIASGPESHHFVPAISEIQ